MKIVGYISSAILILFGVLFILGSGDPAKGQSSWLVVGIVLVSIGMVIVYFSARKPKVASDTNVTLKLDLPGQVAVNAMKCKSCGGNLSSDNIKMVNGAPVVTCPFCNTVYTLTEEPKW
jgi:cbb3-type cytochrome oxidase subunit 3